jgi:hypothetical protein
MAARMGAARFTVVREWGVVSSVADRRSTADVSSMVEGDSTVVAGSTVVGDSVADAAKVALGREKTAGSAGLPAVAFFSGVLVFRRRGCAGLLEILHRGK